jgi:hypothetical protein
MSIVVIIVAWLLAIVTAVGVAKRWNAPAGHWSYNQPTWWVWGERSWRGYRRTVLPAALILVFGAIALTLPTPIGVYFGVAALFLLFPLALAIVLFNWPKWMVPPPSRTEPGALFDSPRTPNNR